jgi:hypothetical protein
MAPNQVAEEFRLLRFLHETLKLQLGEAHERKATLAELLCLTRQLIVVQDLLDFAKQRNLEQVNAEMAAEATVVVVD